MVLYALDSGAVVRDDDRLVGRALDCRQAVLAADDERGGVGVGQGEILADYGRLYQPCGRSAVVRVEQLAGALVAARGGDRDGDLGNADQGSGSPGSRGPIRKGPGPKQAMSPPALTMAASMPPSRRRPAARCTPSL
jgi:hypothetical protein